MFKYIFAPGVLFLFLFISSVAFGQDPETARKQLEEREIKWSEAEFLRVARVGDGNLLKLFLTGGMKPDTVDSEGRTALMLAVENGHADAVKVLIESGAAVDATANSGMTSLMLAANTGRIGIIRLLMENGANVNSAARDGRTSLLFASSAGYTDIINILLDKGAYIDAVDGDGKTALILAASKGRVDAVKVLLDKGGDANLRDNVDMTALMWAEKNGYAQLAALLKQAGGREVYSAPSQTMVNPQLQRDVWNHILQLELASDAKCRDHSISGTGVLQYPSMIGIDKWVEEWQVDRCGTTFYYRIEFRPDGNGGTYFKVIEEKKPAP